VEGEAPLHLGGSWFEGMAEEVTKRSATVQFDKMRGRYTDEEEAQDLLGHGTTNVDTDMDVGLLHREEVELEVREWRPHKQTGPRGWVWTDPGKDPRLVPAVSSRDMEVLSGRPVLDVSYSLVRPRSKVAVDMSRQVGRSDDELEGEDALFTMGALDGADQGMAPDVAQEMDEGLRRGHAASSRVRRGANVVDMKRQPPRGLEPGSESDSEGPAPVYDVSYALVHPRTGRGVSDWSKAPERTQAGGISGGQRTGAEDDGDEEGGMGEAEELILSPKRESTSRFILYPPTLPSLFYLS